MNSFTQASTDRTLDRAAGKQSTTGARLLLVAGIMAVVGIALMAVKGDALDFPGVLLAALAAPLTIGGLGLTLAGLVGGRAAKHKDFA